MFVYVYWLLKEWKGLIFRTLPELREKVNESMALVRARTITSSCHSRYLTDGGKQVANESHRCRVLQKRRKVLFIGSAMMAGP